ncbi:DUF4192 domain-containing protein [Isoptericola jiangsuensis]|uniref:DUF4192 domain-containing protein n=1 Tax=Isoptericola jiangsuensis TaxID=548579 RepID=UPI003AAB0DBA
MTATSGVTTAPITLRSPHDLLASIPYQLGFRPTESVVLACVTRRRRLDLVARVGLDDLERDPAGVLDTLRRAVVQVDPAMCALVVYTARAAPDVAGQVSTVRDAVGPLVELDEWLVTPEGYRGLGCTDGTCCPEAGHPLETLRSSPAEAAHVLAGRYVADSAEEAFRIDTADPAPRGLAARAARRSEESRHRHGGDVDADRAWRRDALAAWRAALRESAHTFTVPDAAIPVALLGRVAAALDDRQVRDAALLTLVPGGDGAADATIDPTATADAATARMMAAVTDPGSAVRPDDERTEVAVHLLQQVVAHAPRRLAPAPLTLLAFLAWWQGDGPRASHRLTQVHRLDPRYRLALLLGSVLTAGLPPGWIRAEAHAQERPA